MSVVWETVKEAEKIHAYLQMYGLLLCPDHPGGKVRPLWIYDDLVQPLSEIHPRYVVSNLQDVWADPETS